MSMQVTRAYDEFIEWWIANPRSRVLRRRMVYQLLQPREITFIDCILALSQVRRRHHEYGPEWVKVSARTIYKHVKVARRGLETSVARMAKEKFLATMVCPSKGGKPERWFKIHTKELMERIGS